MNEQPTTKVDPLAKLFTHDMGAREIAAFILHYLRVDRDTLRVQFFPRMRLSVKQRIVLYLLALRVMAFQKLIPSNSVNSAKIAEDLEVIGSTVRPIVKQLVDERLVTRDVEKREYSISIGAVRLAMKYIEKMDRN